MQPAQLCHAHLLHGVLQALLHPAQREQPVSGTASRSSAAAAPSSQRHSCLERAGSSQSGCEGMRATVPWGPAGAAASRTERSSKALRACPDRMHRGLQPARWAASCPVWAARLDTHAVPAGECPVPPAGFGSKASQQGITCMCQEGMLICPPVLWCQQILPLTPQRRRKTTVWAVFSCSKPYPALCVHLSSSTLCEALRAAGQHALFG